MKAKLAALIVTSMFCPVARADDASTPWRYDHAANQPLSPAQSLSRMTAPPGFKVELVASEPEISNPIAMSFDDRGWIWITESVEYPRKSAGPGRDCVKIIEGCDAQGHATKVT